MTITGVKATLRWSYYTAGVIGAWTVTTGEGSARMLTATVVSTDAGRIGQQPLTFVAPHAKGVWRWPVLDLTITDGAVTARLGPPQD